MSTTYFTVAIPYVNSAPHLGYAYELVLADVAARARRALPDASVRFLGGTDDYSLKNVLAAEAAGVPTADFVTANAQRFAELAGPLGLSFDDFIHTSSDPRHVPAVDRLWRQVAANGDLYRRVYEGDYCVGCEQFYVESELVDGCCPEHLAPVERVEEENWFFRLSAYQDHLERILSSDTLRVEPSAFRQEVLAFVRSGLEDISVSRSASRARGWGVPVPGDPTQVVYVWFDALANYISALGYGTNSPDYQRWWHEADERIHVIGKGILRFHAVYWPAFLAAAGQPLPTRIQVHPYLTVEGAKISKSAGAGVDPVAVVDEFGPDALRWWFARDVNPVTDSDFTTERLVARANEDLAGGLGNLINRIVTLIHRHRDGVVPDGDGPCLAEVVQAVDQAVAALADFELRRGTTALLDGVAALNRDLERTEPWRLARDPADGGRLDPLLVRYWKSALLLAESSSPVIPDLAARLTSLLGDGGRHLPSPAAAFSRIEVRPG